jgi:hypothetical protein
MIFIKIVNGNVSKYPYSFGQLQADNPGTLFPSIPSSECLVDFNTYIVQETQKPEYDYKVEKAVDSVFAEDGEWIQIWAIENLPVEVAEANVRAHRNALIAETDWLALSDNIMPLVWKEYRQSLRDVPSQIGFPYAVIWPTKPS